MRPLTTRWEHETDCVINGSNNLNETDAQPLLVCPVCLRKIQWMIGFDPAQRYEDLARFYRRQKWFEEYDWVQRQLARIPGEKPETARN